MQALSRPLGGVILALALTSIEASAATLVVGNGDGPGEGLNDPTPVAPVGGNPGTTLGQQRLRALEHAASLWGAALHSPVPVQISARFDPLSCTAASGVLGSAYATGAFRDFAGAPLPGTWYVSALANARAGVDLDPATPEITMVFNSVIGTVGCLPGSAFYLGLDGNNGVLDDLIVVAEHEMAHGLGFLSLVDGATGAETGGSPDAFEARLLDVGTGQRWTDMADAERALSAQRTWQVVWDGPQVRDQVPGTLAPGAPLLSLTGGVGEVPIGGAQFGPPLSSPPIMVIVAAAQDAGGNVLDACQPIVNSVAGRVALVDRGNCSFTVKVKNAQNAGAVAVLVANNVPGSPPPELGGSDGTIVIPSAMIAQSDGVALRSALSSGAVTATLGLDGTRYAGARADERVLVYTPSPLVAGSSLSHWDPVATPNTLMEPSVRPDVSHDLDFTPAALADLGWPLPGPAVPALPRGASPVAVGALGAVGALLLTRRSRRTR